MAGIQPKKDDTSPVTTSLESSEPTPQPTQSGQFTYRNSSGDLITSEVQAPTDENQVGYAGGPIPPNLPRHVRQDTFTLLANNKKFVENNPDVIDPHYVDALALQNQLQQERKDSIESTISLAPTLSPPESPPESLWGRVKRKVRENPKTTEAVVEASVGIGGAAALIAAGKGALIGAGIGTAIGGPVGAVVGGVVGCLVGATSTVAVGQALTFAGKKLVGFAKAQWAKRQNTPPAPWQEKFDLEIQHLTQNGQLTDLPANYAQLVDRAISELSADQPRYQPITKANHKDVDRINEPLINEEKKAIRHGLKQVLLQDLRIRQQKGVALPGSEEAAYDFVNEAAGKMCEALLRAREIKNPPDGTGMDILRATRDEAVEATISYIFAILDPNATIASVTRAATTMLEKIDWYRIACYAFDPKYGAEQKPTLRSAMEIVGPIFESAKRNAQLNAGHELGKPLNNLVSEWLRGSFPDARSGSFPNPPNPAIACWLLNVELGAVLPGPAITLDTHTPFMIMNKMLDSALLYGVFRSERDSRNKALGSAKKLLATVEQSVENVLTARAAQKKPSDVDEWQFEHANRYCPPVYRHIAAEELVKYLPKVEAVRLAEQYIRRPQDKLMVETSDEESPTPSTQSTINTPSRLSSAPPPKFEN